ncbi:hypothetical protein D9C73_014378 [Collichthys lucidus]|uniref:Uncharacterized protein n=1 Tax=Collichthys lucidus TaxID=240159 RepID=A0A4V6AQ71_COLLU|nr:hypothetical protein D9C73_014378 [Collichthys lucidus]
MDLWTKRVVGIIVQVALLLSSSYGTTGEALRAQRRFLSLRGEEGLSRKRNHCHGSSIQCIPTSILGQVHVCTRTLQRAESVKVAGLIPVTGSAIESCLASTLGCFQLARLVLPILSPLSMSLFFSPNLTQQHTRHARTINHSNIISEGCRGKTGRGKQFIHFIDLHSDATLFHSHYIALSHSICALNNEVAITDVRIDLHDLVIHILSVEGNGLIIQQLQAVDGFNTRYIKLLRRWRPNGKIPRINPLKKMLRMESVNRSSFQVSQSLTSCEFIVFQWTACLH